ncbi:hypothetical protein ANANG_G00254270 [Anguilla anguilla]|uniref:Uncharacterized protein n=1 Tax=Anguilla anguilla TaxID=7936 RepID=A0A9D3LSU9_ANGAN|nr:hypothetical protein ANANG_G00254270 [Anguilla anguilla]
MCRSAPAPPLHGEPAAANIPPKIARPARPGPDGAPRREETGGGNGLRNGGTGAHGPPASSLSPQGSFWGCFSLSCPLKADGFSPTPPGFPRSAHLSCTVGL